MSNHPDVKTTSQPCGKCGDDGPHVIQAGHFWCNLGHCNEADTRTMSQVRAEAEGDWSIYGESKERYPRGWTPDDEGHG
jgi:hypothetical protein